jgi:hypothetical protein
VFDDVFTPFVLMFAYLYCMANRRDLLGEEFLRIRWGLSWDIRLQYYPSQELVVKPYLEPDYFITLLL